MTFKYISILFSIFLFLNLNFIFVYTVCGDSCDENQDCVKSNDTCTFCNAGICQIGLPCNALCTRDSDCNPEECSRCIKISSFYLSSSSCGGKSVPSPSPSPSKRGNSCPPHTAPVCHNSATLDCHRGIFHLTKKNHSTTYTYYLDTNTTNQYSIEIIRMYEGIYNNDILTPLEDTILDLSNQVYTSTLPTSVYNPNPNSPPCQEFTNNNITVVDLKGKGGNSFKALTFETNLSNNDDSTFYGVYLRLVLNTYVWSKHSNSSSNSVLVFEYNILNNNEPIFFSPNEYDYPLNIVYSPFVNNSGFFDTYISGMSYDDLNNLNKPNGYSKSTSILLSSNNTAQVLFKYTDRENLIGTSIYGIGDPIDSSLVPVNQNLIANCALNGTSPICKISDFLVVASGDILPIFSFWLNSDTAKRVYSLQLFNCSEIDSTNDNNILNTYDMNKLKWEVSYTTSSVILKNTNGFNNSWDSFSIISYFDLSHTPIEVSHFNVNITIENYRWSEESTNKTKLSLAIQLNGDDSYYESSTLILAGNSYLQVTNQSISTPSSKNINYYNDVDHFSLNYLLYSLFSFSYNSILSILSDSVHVPVILNINKNKLITLDYNHFEGNLNHNNITVGIKTNYDYPYIPDSLEYLGNGPSIDHSYTNFIIFLNIFIAIIVLIGVVTLVLWIKIRKKSKYERID
eukprot:TRINITY_DN13036_c0_g1_i1.p1 TRINITY_DN13036_c0_g1~~TRINITY_DN13036_c0_g1_i1.p1  ORF type:complete len:683 (-),score=112.42 TRINITY_DN13036_c0_g1_i1:150-2198(-)